MIREEEKCTNECVAMLVWSNSVFWEPNKLLMIESNIPPFGFSIPVGHLEKGENFEEAVVRELKKETGLVAINLNCILKNNIEADKFTPVCSKGSSSLHYLELYKVSYKKGDLKLKEESKNIGWYDISEVYKLSLKTEKYLKSCVSEKEWKKSPGITPVCYNWLKELGTLDLLTFKKASNLNKEVKKFF